MLGYEFRVRPRRCQGSRRNIGERSHEHEFDKDATVTAAPPPIGRPPPPEGRALRRRPRQARAQERIERVLDAAEQLFIEMGYDATTTNAIAQRAETSIGSLYEFFPNKEAVARALADRYVERIGSLYTDVVVDRPGEEGPDIVIRAVEAIDAFYRAHPGAVPLLNGRLTSPQLAEAGEVLQAALVRQIARILQSRRADVPNSRALLLAQVIAEITRALLLHADRAPLSQRRAVVRELELALIGYLHETAPDPIDPVQATRRART
jgi:AcrR family transcriptional regulator